MQPIKLKTGPFSEYGYRILTDWLHTNGWTPPAPKCPSGFTKGGGTSFPKEEIASGNLTEPPKPTEAVMGAAEKESKRKPYFPNDYCVREGMSGAPTYETVQMYERFLMKARKFLERSYWNNEDKRPKEIDLEALVLKCEIDSILANPSGWSDILNKMIEEKETEYLKKEKALREEENK